MPLVAEVKGNSLDDGPGIRSVVFFKGCPLRCVWCHNPETADAGPTLAFDADACLQLGDCLTVCEDAALDRATPGFLDRSRCTLCLRCVDACATGAFQLVGEPLPVDELVARLERYAPFYESSGGGVTLSGGEPTMFPEYCSELLQALKARGIHAALETCGHFDLDRFDEHLDPWLDQLLFDLKLIDDAAHRRHIGRGNARILRNFRALYARHLAGGTPLLPRVPLIPGITATPDNLAGIAALLREVAAERVALLPYNPLWAAKADRVGAPRRYDHDRWMGPEELRACAAHFEGLEVVGL